MRALHPYERSLEIGYQTSEDVEDELELVRTRFRKTSFRSLLRCLPLFSPNDYHQLDLIARRERNVCGVQSATNDRTHWA